MRDTQRAQHTLCSACCHCDPRAASEACRSRLVSACIVRALLHRYGLLPTLRVLTTA